MRILMITDVYFPRINGVSTSIKLFRQTLLSMGHEVTLIAPDYVTQPDQQDLDEHIIRVPSRRVILDPEDRMMSKKYILSLLSNLKVQNFDLVHIHTPFVAHYAGLKLAKGMGVPCIETYHTFFEEYLYHYFSYAPKVLMRYLARMFTRRQCNNVDMLITPSTAMNEVMLGYGVTTTIKIVPTGIELEELKSGGGSMFRKKYAIDENRPVLVYVGRVAHEKNIIFLLEMLSHLKETIADVLLIIAGEGPALNHVKIKVSDLGLAMNVLFVGYMSRDGELQDCYCAGNGFVFASRTETQGLVLLEAMALGVPVVSTAVMGTKDILSPRKGALVTVEDKSIFAGEVQRLLQNPFLQARLATEAREYVKQWTATEMTGRLVNLYQDLMAKQPKTQCNQKSLDDPLGGPADEHQARFDISNL